MNEARRKRLSELKTKLESVANELEGLKDAESDAFESLPESMKEGEKGQAMEAAMEYMQEALDSIENAVNSIDAAVE